MSRQYLLNLINRIDMLLDEADDILAKYPSAGQRHGFMESLGMAFNPGATDGMNSAEIRLQSIFAEIMGVVVTVKETLRDYGVYLQNDTIGSNIENARGYRQAIRAMRSAVGYMRSKALGI